MTSLPHDLPPSRPPSACLPARSYQVQYEYEQADVVVTATLNSDSPSSFTIMGQPAQSGVPTQPLPLDSGAVTQIVRPCPSLPYCRPSTALL